MAYRIPFNSTILPTPANEGRAFDRPPPRPAATAVNPWIKARQMLQGIIPLAERYRSDAGDYVAAGEPGQYLNMAQRERLPSNAIRSMIDGRPLHANTHHSGHDRPEPQAIYRFMKFLQREGIPLDQVAVKLHTLPHHINAREFVDGVMPAVKGGLTLEDAVSRSAEAATPVEMPIDYN